jgi:hypothetical protein
MGAQQNSDGAGHPFLVVGVEIVKLVVGMAVAVVQMVLALLELYEFGSIPNVWWSYANGSY